MAPRVTDSGLTLVDILLGLWARPETPQEKINRLYWEQDWSISDLAEDVGISYGAMAKAMNDLGIKKKPRGRRERRKLVNVTSRSRGFESLQSESNYRAHGSRNLEGDSSAQTGENLQGEGCGED